MNAQLRATPRSKTPIAVVGIGKIARNQHLPAIARSPDFELAAAVSLEGEAEGVPNYRDFEEFLKAEPRIPTVAICTPPLVRPALARAAAAAGRHVLLEKPPGATLGEVESLAALAETQRVTLFATWHSQFAPAVDAAKAWLRGKKITGGHMVWKEDVRRWHPGQDWIWQPGGFGVFDPAINGFSILTEILPDAVSVSEAILAYPENCHTPIAGEIALRSDSGYALSADLDFLQEGPQTWDITLETNGGRLKLESGGAVLSIDGEVVCQEPEAEYDRIYRRFAQLLRARESDVDLAPFRMVADCFMLARRVYAPPFHEERSTS